MQKFQTLSEPVVWGAQWAKWIFENEQIYQQNIDSAVILGPPIKQKKGKILTKFILMY